MAETILVVDDDTAFRSMLREALEERGWEVAEAGDAETGIDMVGRGGYDLVLHDVRLPGMDGIEALEHIRRADPLVDIIVMTAHSTRDSAVEALQHGAYDYFTKPFSLAEMEVVIRRVLEKRRLQNEVRRLRRSLEDTGPSAKIIGQSPAMRRVVELVEKVAPLDAGVLVTGETGTGKELISDTIHALSDRASGPFVKLNCAAIPENLLESELFGHEKGAFTGATSTKKGKFELASEGTILLDEIGDMPLHLQPKLLRAVEQKQVERLGGHKPIAFDARIIAATNQNLAQRVEAGEFRSDLFYRLNVATIELPPLRDRLEDIPELCEHFLQTINRKLGIDVRGVSKAGTQALMRHHWPGNVRQLANTLERAAIFCTNDLITDRDVDSALQRVPAEPGQTQTPLLPDESLQLKEALMEYERGLIVSALRRSGGVQTEAAKQLGVTPKNLWNKLQKHNIDPNNPHN
ncbi:two-component system, NtrC family, response regulator AtoC [Paucidesulfovibrio gracilis DSM 16080]|uniref:DNA-binding transcriptional regulator NtrC n=1 Tax=Paucidesulfovibrio gracilis DSM 16080 TaxID=1121449 RepID=A0A1T4XM10_9BACT|nr:sigma-54 dependent transcriptional regulator [Paucidesulfovibrio gracilis]SKA90556.1 two-component system, NtrC family, response regulator AtoC [Paucidesulfovibrio gracilis DSM 16080]